ncbi:MAG: F0F1 ATP synthase subunit gamma [Alphaproteobacteria bacterium]
MANLKALKGRITSVTATRKITKAMQMVAAAKLRRAQEQAEAARPYAAHMSAVLANLAGSYAGREDAPKLMAGTGQDKVHLLVVATAERGLCGGFNSNIAKLARTHTLRLLGEGKTVKILCVGRKGNDVLKRQFAANIIDLVSFVSLKTIGFEQACGVGRKVLDLFDAGEFDVCTLFFARFKSVIDQKPVAEQLIPAIFEDAETGTNDTVYEYEPEETEILAELLPRNLNVQIFSAILENAASEQGARMSAMDSATRNAGEMIDKLTLQYNRSRQAIITSELIEIISGAEAL